MFKINTLTLNVNPASSSLFSFSYLFFHTQILNVLIISIVCNSVIVLFPRRVCPHLVPSSCLFILSDYLFFNRILKGFFSQAIHPKRFAISAITSLLSLRHVCDVWQHTRNKPQNVFLLLQTMSIGWQKRITILPPNPEVPGSIPNLVEGWIFGWPSFPLKFTQLSIPPGWVKWVPAHMDRFEAAARGAYIYLRRQQERGLMDENSVSLFSFSYLFFHTQILNVLIISIVCNSVI